MGEPRTIVFLINKGLSFPKYGFTCRRFPGSIHFLCPSRRYGIQGIQGRMKMEVWRWKIKPNTLNSLVGGASQGGLCHWLPYSTVLLRAWAFSASSCKVRPNVSWHSSQSLHLLVFSTDYFKQVPWRLGECLHTCKSWNFLQSSLSPIHQCHCLLRGQEAHTGSKMWFSFLSTDSPSAGSENSIFRNQWFFPLPQSLPWCKPLSWVH